MTSNIPSHAERFYRDFGVQAKEINDKLNATTSISSPEQCAATLDGCLSKIAELQRRVQDAASYTNNHDQMVYVSRLKALQANAERVRNAANPKAKFNFKSVRQAVLPNTESASSDTTPVPSGSMIITSEQSTKTNLLGDGANQLDLKNLTVSARQLSEKPAASIKGLTRCVVDLATEQERPHSGLHVVDTEHSILLCGTIAGGLHVTNVNAALIVARTHQFRMHRCKNVVVYVDASSSPVIEECTNIKFAPLPDTCFIQLQGRASLNKNSWNTVLDFQHPGASGPSPNWEEVPRGERLPLTQASANMLGSLPSIKDIKSVASLSSVLRHARAVGVEQGPQATEGINTVIERKTV